MTQEIQANFTQWYRTVDIGDDVDRVKTRWKQVKKAVSEIEIEDIETLIRVAFAVKQKSNADVVKKIATYFGTKDSPFDPLASAKEFQILAASVIALTIAEGGYVGAMTALSVNTTECAGIKVYPSTVPLSKYAEESLKHLSTAALRRPSLEEYTVANETTVEVNTEGGDFAPVVKALATTFQKSLNQAKEEFATALSEVQRITEMQDEELQMLWWYLGDKSWQLEVDFSAITKEQKTVVMALELSNQTNVIPGPRSIPALLVKTGISQNEEFSVVEIINNVGETLFDQLGEHSHISPTFTPMHFAISKRNETKDNDSWVAGWAAITEIPASAKASQLALAMQFYRERLILDRLE